MDEPHKGQKASVGPAVDGDAAEVDEAVLFGHKLQALHLVFNLHLALGEKPGTFSPSSVLVVKASP